MATYNEPIWTTPNIQYLRTPPALTQLLPAPLLLSALMVEHIQQHFALAARIWNPALKSRIWTPGLPIRNLFIGGSAAESSQDNGATPAICVGLAELAAIDVGIPVTSLNVSVAGIPQNDSQGTNELWQGKHTIKCQSKHSAEASALAAEVHTLLALCRRGLITEAGLLSASLAKIPLQAAQLPDGGRQYIEGSVLSWDVRVAFKLLDEEVW